VFSDELDDGSRILGTVTKWDLSLTIELMHLCKDSRHIWGSLSTDGKIIAGYWGWQPNMIQGSARVTLNEILTAPIYSSAVPISSSTDYISSCVPVT